MAVAAAYETEKLSWVAKLRTDLRIAQAADLITQWIRDANDTDLDSLAPGFPMGLASVEYLRAVLFSAESLREWQRHRVIYRVHPELVASLVETDRNTPIPCEVFRRLPHPDPFVVFPVPLPAPASGSPNSPMAEPPVYIGMLVTGLTKAFELCSTVDPRLHYLNAALIGRIHFSGQEPEFQEYNIRIPCVPERFTIDQMIMRNRRTLKVTELTAVMLEVEIGRIPSWRKSAAVSVQPPPRREHTHRAGPRREEASQTTCAEHCRRCWI